MANIKLKNLLVCENAIVSQEGKLSVFNMFTEIKSNGFPAVHPRLTIVSLITGDNGIYDEKIEIVAPDSKVIAQVSNKVEINNQDGSGVLADFINTAFLMEGKYWIKISIDGNVITNAEENFISIKKI